ncbi:sexual development [Pyrenophora seminiperda CCB06]|uniref:Sexual development n=1 Tax=Pyrenophora seminiperda CCB06 TaxID=1302712 RepID=A0A3M7M8D7_9PLEO|nr:sexual development [Pyrenophora seminiperda CCB06]
MASFAVSAPTGNPDFSPDNVYFPLANGFPNPNQEAILDIQKDGHGTLPNGPPPPTISPDGVINLKLIALNELFEVAFFSELVFNLTNKVDGYNLGREHDYVVDSLKAIVAQEEMHVLNANEALKHFNQVAIEGCKYDFPVDDFASAINLAATFTSIVLGTLQDVEQLFARSQDLDLVRAVASVIGNEGSQEGFFRVMQGKIPSAQPFVTTATRDFAFTAIQDFVVEGSCPNIDTIPLKRFKPLAVETKEIKPRTQKLAFSFSMEHAGMFDVGQLKLVLINGQNVPVVSGLENVKMADDRVMFEAEFPFEELVMDGLTIAAVTMGKDTFANADEVAQQTVFGPGIIIVD